MDIKDYFIKMSDSFDEETYLYGTEYVKSIKTDDKGSIELNAVSKTIEEKKFDKIAYDNKIKEEPIIDLDSDFIDEHFESITSLTAENSNFVIKKEEEVEIEVDNSVETVVKSHKKMTQIVFGETKSLSMYSLGTQDNLQTDRISIEDLTTVGFINGVPAHEFDIESLAEKPWRSEDADLSNYFNYGFNESTWHDFCERQKRLTQGQPLPPGIDAESIQQLSSRKRLYARPIDVVTTLGPKPMHSLRKHFSRYTDENANECQSTNTLTDDHCTCDNSNCSIEKQFDKDDIYVETPYINTDLEEPQLRNSGWTPFIVNIKREPEDDASNDDTKNKKLKNKNEENIEKGREVFRHQIRIGNNICFTDEDSTQEHEDYESTFHKNEILEPTNDYFNGNYNKSELYPIYDGHQLEMEEDMRCREYNDIQCHYEGKQFNHPYYLIDEYYN